MPDRTGRQGRRVSPGARRVPAGHRARRLYGAGVWRDGRARDSQDRRTYHSPDRRHWKSGRGNGGRVHQGGRRRLRAQDESDPARAGHQRCDSLFPEPSRQASRRIGAPDQRTPVSRARGRELGRHRPVRRRRHDPLRQSRHHPAPWVRADRVRGPECDGADLPRRSRGRARAPPGGHGRATRPGPRRGARAAQERHLALPRRRVHQLARRSECRGDREQLSGRHRSPHPGRTSHFVAEDGSHRPAGGWRGARFQQHPHRDRRIHRSPARRSSCRRSPPPRCRRDLSGRTTRRRVDAPAARVQPAPGPPAEGHQPQRAGTRHRENAAAAHRRGHSPRDGAASAPRQRARRPRPAGTGDRQSRRERARRDARRRPPHHRNAERRARRGLRH